MYFKSFLTISFLISLLCQISKSQVSPDVCSQNYADKSSDGCLITIENCIVLWMQSVQIDWQKDNVLKTETIIPKDQKPQVTSNCTADIKTNGTAISSSLTLLFNQGLVNASSVELNFTIESAPSGYWIVEKSTIKIDGSADETFNLTASEITAASTFSFSCSLLVIPTLKSSTDKTTDYATVRLRRFQLQPFKASNAATYFTDSYDCATWFTLATWMGLLTLLLFTSIVSCGVYMLASISTMDRFENPKAKPLSVPTTD